MEQPDVNRQKIEPLTSQPEEPVEYDASVASAFRSWYLHPATEPSLVSSVVSYARKRLQEAGFRLLPAHDFRLALLNGCYGRDLVRFTSARYVFDLYEGEAAGGPDILDVIPLAEELAFSSVPAFRRVRPAGAIHARFARAVRLGVDGVVDHLKRVGVVELDGPHCAFITQAYMCDFFVYVHGVEPRAKETT